MVAISLCLWGCGGSLLYWALPVTASACVAAGTLESQTGRCVAFVLTLALFVALVTDTFVYQQYRFHVNWAMIDLALVGGREVFSFSTGMVLKIAFLVVCLAVVSLILVWVTTKLAIKAVWPCVVILLGYLIVNAVSAYSVSQNVKPVTVLAERIPLYYPIRANTLLSKFGLVAVGDEKLNLSEKVGSFHYPLNELILGNGKNLNVLILAIDSLRADVVDAKTMPNLTKLQQRSIVFRDHYSAGNATRAGVFGLFLRTAAFLLAERFVDKHSLINGDGLSASRI